MIIRIAVRHRYTRIDNRVIEDKDLSYGALGMMAYLLSKPDHWEIDVTHLWKRSKHGRDYVYQRLQELEDAGYLRKIQHNEGGRFGKIMYILSEGPLPENPEAVGKSYEQCSGNEGPLPENPEAVGQGQNVPETAEKVENQELNGAQNRFLKIRNIVKTEVVTTEKDNVPTKTGKKLGFTDDDIQCAAVLFGYVQKVYPQAREPNWKAWANTIRLMRERDNRTHAEIDALFAWANRHHFWWRNILGPDKLRKQWDRLSIERDGTPPAGSPGITGNGKMARAARAMKEAKGNEETRSTHDPSARPAAGHR